MTPPPGDHTTPTGWRLVRAGTDAVPAWVRQFFQIRRPGVRRRRWLTVVAVLALTGLTGWLLAATPLLAVQEVRVTGTTILSPAQVREVVAVPEQTPLLRVPVDEVADRVRGLAAVARVEVYREWPDTLVVEIVERVPAAAVRDGDRFTLIDQEGVAFHTVANPPAELPVVELTGTVNEDRAVRAALVVLSALTPPLRAQLTTLTVAGPASIELSLETGQTVRWGDETASEDKARVATVLLDHEVLQEQGLSVIDVSTPEVVAVR